MKTRLFLLASIVFLIGSSGLSGQGIARRMSPVGSLQMDHAGFYLSYPAKPDRSAATPDTGTYIMDFENVPDFSLVFNNWTVNDVDKHDTYGITGYSFLHQTGPMAFLCFNPALVAPSMATDQAIQPHSGARFGACFSSNPPSNNDWFISPRIQLGSNGSFSFWVKSYNDTYGLDTYTVAVSTTDNNPASFTVISGAQPLQTTTTWGKKNFSLANYNNQQVYVAINCTSNDHFLMMIDDLEIRPQASLSLTADFSGDKTSLRAGETVNFLDQSTGGPVTWSWKFTGGIPATSILQNPTGIRYNTPGNYPVSLKVSNGSVGDSITKTAYVSVSDYPSSITLDFEEVIDFNMVFDPWMVIDKKGGATYGIQSVFFPNNYQPMAYICFNPAKTTPPMTNLQAHSGQKLGCSFSSAPPNNPNDKWLISPKLSLGINPQVELWVKTFNNQFGDERFNVSVSTTDLASSSFIPLTLQPEAAPVDWTKKTYSLQDYTNQDIYLGIQCVTNDGFIFMLDDIFVTSTVGLNETGPLSRLVVFPNPATDYLNINCPVSSPVPVNIEMISILGETISSWKEVPVSGKVTLDIHEIPQGVYLLRISTEKDKVTRKISVIHP